MSHVVSNLAHLFSRNVNTKKVINKLSFKLTFLRKRSQISDINSSNTDMYVLFKTQSHVKFVDITKMFDSFELLF